MIAILGGLGAAGAWAISTLCSSRSSRLIAPVTVVAWVMLTGLVITAPLAAVRGMPGNLDTSSGAWLALSGVLNVGGLMLAYGALRIGKVALVAPLVSTEGAITAVIAVFAGESLAPAVGVTLALIVAGVCLAGLPPSEAPLADRLSADGGQPDWSRHTEATLLALAAAVAFGASLYATARAGAVLPVAWVALSASHWDGRARDTACSQGRLQLTRKVVHSVLRASARSSASIRSPSGPGTASPSPLFSSQFAALVAVRRARRSSPRSPRTPFLVNGSAGSGWSACAS